MLHELISGRLFGHPVHPMLVHFPTALFSAGFLFDIAGLVWGDQTLFFASFYVLLLGLAVGIIAGIFGAADFIKLADRPAAFRTAGWHGSLQFLVLIIFGLIVGIKFQAYPDLHPPGLLQMGVMGLGLATMLAGNYLGGELVFRYKVGIDE